LILREVEANVLEALRRGESQSDIAAAFGLNRGTVVSIVARLSELAVVESIGYGKYKILIDKYEVTDEMRVANRSKPMTVEIPEDIELYIRGHYRKIPRRKLARRLGLKKTMLNHMILQLGLGE
jgi:hypothetical protein